MQTQTQTQTTTTPARPAVAGARRVVVKLGTRVLTQGDGRLARARLVAVVERVAALRAAGREAIVVSSGAVGLGRETLGLADVPLDLEMRQACAALGQARLIALYQQALARHRLLCAQVLVTQGDFDDRVRYLNLRATLGTLLRLGVVPVLNENDAVSTEELGIVARGERPVFGDNDRLSALVAAKLGADLLVLVTDVAGLYDRDPRRDPAATLLSVVPPGEGTAIAAGGPGSHASRGGMRSKLEAARIARRGGCQAVICSGLDPDALARVLAGDDVGTWFPAAARLDARQRWMGFAAAPRGVLHLDAGAVAAVRERGSSLLAAGVPAMEGAFRRGDVVELRDPAGAVLGRGFAAADRAAADAWRAAGAGRGAPLLVRRDRMVLELTTEEGS